MPPLKRTSWFFLSCVLALAASGSTRAGDPAPAPVAPASKAVPPASQPGPLGPGSHRRALTVDGRPRSYLVHVPPGHDAAQKTPVVLVFHGAFMTAATMVPFCGLNKKADDAGFVVVYPNGTGVGEAALFWNASAKPAADGPPDDVAFTARLLDDLATVVNVDPKRVYAAGMSNGGMMCHRLAAELSGRIAAIAPVTGTLALARVRPARPVPVIQFHGTADRIVPFDGPTGRTPPTMRFTSVERTMRAWAEANGCPEEPRVSPYPDATDDGTTVTRQTYGPGRGGGEVVLIEVTGGGHTWPGQAPPAEFLGKSTSDVSANDIMWEFFERHPMP